MKAIARQVACLTASGLTVEETARRLRISNRSIERHRANPEVRRLIEEKERTGLTPEDVLEAALYSPNETVRMKAAVELSRIRNANGYTPDDGAPRIEVYGLPDATRPETPTDAADLLQDDPTPHDNAAEEAAA